MVIIASVTIQQVNDFETKALAIDLHFLQRANDNAFCGGTVGLGALRVVAQNLVVLQVERRADLDEFYHRQAKALRNGKHVVAIEIATLVDAPDVEQGHISLTAFH